MKRYQDDSKSINEGAAEQTLLDNLFNFYLLKYANRSISQTEEHFLTAALALEASGEVDKETLNEFLEDKGIERRPVVKRSSYSSGNDGCGHGSYTRGC